MKASTLIGHNNPIYTVIVHPTEGFCYTAGNDKGIVEWNLITKTHQRVFNQIKQTVYCLEIIIELNLLIAGCNDGNLYFFDLNNTKLLANLNLGSAIFHLTYVVSKKELLASNDKGQIFIINPDKKIIIHEFLSGNQKVRSFAFNKQQNLLATISNDELIWIYNLDDYGLIHQFKGHEMGIGSVKFSPDGKNLLTGGRDAHLKVWQTFDWSLEKSFAAHLFAIYQIIFHPSLPYFATASRDKSIKIWRSEDFSLFKNLSIEKSKEGHRLSVNDISWSNDGKNLLSVGDDKLLKIWDFEVSV